MAEMKNPRSDIREIFDAGLQAANPGEAIRRTVSLKGERLEVDGRTYNLNDFERILVVGAGKAAASMAAAL
jgi:hydroxypyruvate reductase